MSSIFFNSYKSQDNDRYVFNGFLFTNCGASGPYGPSIEQIRSSYPTSWAQDNSNLFSTISGMQFWRVPVSGNYQVVVAGAREGRPNGRGAIITSNIFFPRNYLLKMLVGHAGSWSGFSGSSGGGGTFLATVDNNPILVAGGGGGGWNSGGEDASLTTSATTGSGGAIPGTNGRGGRTTDDRDDVPGSGFYTNAGDKITDPIIWGLSPAAPGPRAFIFGGNGGTKLGEIGSFGGGGFGGGGGGGYSGGGGTASGFSGACGGGGSFDVFNLTNNTATRYTQTINNQAGGFNSSNGFIFFKLIKSVPALDELSTSTKTGIRCVFAFKQVLSSYTGPIFRIRNPANNAESNVFWDFSTNRLWTGQGASGTPVEFWLNFQTGNVVTWYDQSGLGNHATQSTVALQPRLDTSNERVDFTVSGSYFFLPQGTVPLNRTFTMSFKHSNIPVGGVGALIGGGNPTTNNSNTIRFDGPTGYRNYFIGNDYTPALNQSILDNSVVSFVNYITGSAPTTTTSTSATGTVATSWTTAGFFNNRPFTFAPVITRTNWNGTLGTDTLGRNNFIPDGTIGTPMYWAFVSGDALGGDERTLIEFQ